MSTKAVGNGGMAKDTIIYMIAKAIEGIVGVVTMGIMTYLFVSSQMGYYSTVNIVVTTVAMVAVQWLVQSVMRYINKYDIQGRYKEFYSTVFLSWLVVTAAVVALAAVLTYLLKNNFADYSLVKRFTSVYTYSIIISGILWFVTYSTAQLVIAMLAAIREAKLNLILSMITVIGRLVFMVALCKAYGSRIEWIFISYFLTDLIVSVIGLAKLRVYKYLNFKNADLAIFKELKSYGMPLMGNQLTTSVLNRLDVFIVLAFMGSSMAGIYQTNYSLISTAFTLLNASVMRGCYPSILRAWSEGKTDDVKHLLNEAVRMYMIIAVPAVVGVFGVSRLAASAIFESKYVEGHIVMFWVAFGMMFLGLTEYSIKHWELTANTKAIFLRSLISCVLKIVMYLAVVNISKSYWAAAATTFLSFFIYFVLARFGTRKYLKWKMPVKKYVNILGSAFIMLVIIELIKTILPEGKLCLAICIICGIIVYGAALYLSGEVKNEVKLILNKIKK